MLRKLPACWNVMLLLVAFSQCSRCTSNPVEDLTKWELFWDQAVALGSSLPSLDIANGIVCRVPSEDAVYFLSPTGECHKFTQTSGLVHERVVNFSGISSQESFFAFAAGSAQTQTLHVGIINQQTITLHQYEAGTWKSVGSYNIASAVAWLSSSSVAACSVHEENQCNGLIFLQSVVLCYDAEKNTFDTRSTRPSTGANSLKAALEIAPDTILVSEEHSGQLCCWTSKYNKYAYVKMPAYTSALKRTSLFLLHAKKLMPQAFCARFIEENGQTELQFYTLTHTSPYKIQLANPLPQEEEDVKSGKVDNQINHSGSFVVPFLEVAYVVSKDKDGQPVYYKGCFREV
jgi:hypothetical protein